MIEPVTIEQLKLANELRKQFEDSLIEFYSHEFHGDGFSVTLRNDHSIADDPMMKRCDISVVLRMSGKSWKRDFSFMSMNLKSIEGVRKSLKPIKEWIAEEITKEILSETEPQLQKILSAYQ